MAAGFYQDADELYDWTNESLDEKGHRLGPTLGGLACGTLGFGGLAGSLGLLGLLYRRE